MLKEGEREREQEVVRDCKGFIKSALNFESIFRRSAC